jgi:hypothetical protein
MAELSSRTKAGNFRDYLPYKAFSTDSRAPNPAIPMLLTFSLYMLTPKASRHTQTFNPDAQHPVLATNGSTAGQVNHRAGGGGTFTRFKGTALPGTRL